jgi:arginyl-tRNA synthetase
VARELHESLTRDTVAPPVPGRVIVEHTSINPNKAAHIGHLRNATLGDTFVRVLRHRGRDVGIQNYIDDTGVQVADVVVGFLYLEKRTLADVLRIEGRFDYYCWDLYARVGDFYAADPANKARQAGVLHAIEEGGNDTARLAEHIASRIVDCHLTTMERLGIRYDLLAHESDILRLHFWDRAFELLKQSGAIRLETEGKNAGCWVLAMREEAGQDLEAPAGRSAPEGRGSDDDKIIVRSNGTVTYTGKDIAYQLWKLGLLDRDFRYRRHRRYEDGHILWTTTSDAGEPGAPVFGHAREVYNVIDVGQSYPQRVVKAGVAALGHPQAAQASHHLAYEKVVLSPATARALGYTVSEDDAVVKVSGRKGLGVKADDLLDALVEKARGEIASRDPGRGEAAREETARAIATGALRYFLLKFGRTKIITFDMEEALAFTGETGPYVQNGVVRARNIFAKLETEGHGVPSLLARARDLDLDTLLTGEEGDLVWSLFLLMARTDEVAEQAVRAEEVALVAKHAFAVAQDGIPGLLVVRVERLRHREGGPLVLPEARVFRPARRERVGARIPGPGRGYVPAADGTTHRRPRHPRAGAHVSRPLIGVTAGLSATNKEIFAVRDDYVRSVEDAGGVPVVLAPGPLAHVPDLIGRLDGLLLSGGADLDPAHYGEAPHETVYGVSSERDSFELALLREALARDLPLLAICRGHQVLNVAMGGTLVQDIPSQIRGALDHDPKTERWLPAHDVRILPGTRLREILGRDRVAVNSFHHQSIRTPGQGLVVSAWAVGDEVIEGVELPSRRFVVGVQWHPEAFWDQPQTFQPLFTALVQASR